MLSWLAGLFTGGKNPIDSIGDVIDKITTSDEEKLQAQKELMEVMQKPLIKQIMVNLAEAQHRSWYVAGWRPGIGWVCALTLFTFYIPKNVIAAIVWLMQCGESIARAKDAGIITTLILPSYPVTLDETLFELLLGMLGLAAMRTVEKVNKTAK